MNSEIYHVDDLFEELREEIDEMLKTADKVENSKILVEKLLKERQMFLNELQYESSSEHYWTRRFDNAIDLELNSDLIQRINEIQMKMKMSRGQLVSRLFSTFSSLNTRYSIIDILGDQRKRYSISHMGRLEIEKEDLEIDGIINFQHISHLIIGKSVNEDLFIEKIRRIEHCKKVTINAPISKLIQYSKISFAMIEDDSTVSEIVVDAGKTARKLSKFCNLVLRIKNFG
jgi:hypothetical protein